MWILDRSFFISKIEAQIHNLCPSRWKRLLRTAESREVSKRLFKRVLRGNESSCELPLKGTGFFIIRPVPRDSARGVLFLSKTKASNYPKQYGKIIQFLDVMRFIPALRERGGGFYNITMLYNIYCDESCHLLNDYQKVFVIGAVWVEKERTEKIFRELREIKKRHGLSVDFEAKWTKISIGKVAYYQELVEYFFKNPHLHFRGVVVPDKSILNHKVFYQDHDTWYYKMFYNLLNFFLKKGNTYNLYLDLKDSVSNKKVLELKRILSIANKDEFVIATAQQVRSHEVETMQIADILIGALAYFHRGLNSNQGKMSIISLIEKRIGKRLIFSSGVSEEKYNILVWHPRV